MATTNVMEGGAINRNADWYYANLDELLPKGEQVVGAFDTFGGGCNTGVSSCHVYTRSEYQDVRSDVGFRVVRRVGVPE